MYLCEAVYKLSDKVDTGRNSKYDHSCAKAKPSECHKRDRNNVQGLFRKASFFASCMEVILFMLQIKEL